MRRIIAVFVAVALSAAVAGCLGPYARPVNWGDAAADVGIATAAGAATGLVAGAIVGTPLGGPAAAGAGVGFLGSVFSKSFRYWWESYQAPEPVALWYPGYATYVVPAYPYGGYVAAPGYYYYYVGPVAP